MPGKQVKDWHVYHECMKDKGGSDADKEYCAKVANAVAGGTIKHSDLAAIVRYGVELGIRDAASPA